MAETVVTDSAQAGQGAAPIQEPAIGAGGASAPVVDIQAEIRKALEESDKKWQSRFDKVLAEKKTVESVKLSTEERLAKIEQEAKAKEIDWARKEARAKASIDDGLDAAIAIYNSEDPADIAKGAAEIRKLIDAETAPLKAKIAELEKASKFGSRPPLGGGAVDGLAAMKAKYDELMKQGKREEANRLYIAMGSMPK